MESNKKIKKANHADSTSKTRKWKINKQKAKWFADHSGKKNQPHGKDEEAPVWEETIQEDSEIRLTIPK